MFFYSTGQWPPSIYKALFSHVITRITDRLITRNCDNSRWNSIKKSIPVLLKFLYVNLRPLASHSKWRFVSLNNIFLAKKNMSYYLNNVKLSVFIIKTYIYLTVTGMLKISLALSTSSHISFFSVLMNSVLTRLFIYFWVDSLQRKEWMNMSTLGTYIYLTSPFYKYYAYEWNIEMTFKLH